MKLRPKLKRGSGPIGVLFSLALAVFVLAGCNGVPAPGERSARNAFGTVAAAYRPGHRKPPLPSLTPESGLSNFLAFAMLNSPEIEAAYDDWAASVERITIERSLPDPQITFQSDIARIVTSVMPGFMQEFPGPGKLRARARAAGAESASRYFAFETAVLQTAFEVKRTGYELQFLEYRIRINRETLSLLGELERIARAQNEVGKGTLQDVLRAQIERDRVRNDIANLEDSRAPAMAAFKAALGLAPGQADPPSPARFEATAGNPDFDDVLAQGLAHNPRLKELEAEIRAAQSGIALAYKNRVPDFSLGLMADVKMSPTLFRPLAGATLPVWRDKIAAEIAQAEAGKFAAEARLSSAQIALAVDFAEKAFASREISRNLELLGNQLIPKARQSLDIARAGYLSGTIDFFNLMDTERTLLNFELARVEAGLEREIVLAQLSLLVAGTPPPGAPVLATLAPDQP